MIKEQIVWVEGTREHAITLANDVGGDAEVHALHLRKGTFEMAHKPVGYLVYMPPQTKWVKLMKGVRVEGDNVIIHTKGNDEARELCADLVSLIDELTKDENEPR